MASVDNRVVRMEFDNAAFEKKLQSTLKALADLDKALKFTGAHKGLADVSAAAKKVDLNPMSNAVQTVSSGFLALSTIAVTALATITHAAITAGARIVQALSLAPVLDGFKEYELNIGSIQTILANTRADGTGLAEVNDALDTLNEYSDKTIYNFGQMTKNIGTFTAAGVDLDTSVSAIKGISNLAAISGSSADQAATAMYQLSQAVSTGTLRLMDWNSVVNAGMGGEVFQKALFETGVAMGTITDAPVGTTFEEWTSKGNSFRDSLQEGWLTGEVLTNTLKGFTGEMTEAQLLSIGYTKQQAAEILELGQSGVEAATKIRTFSQLLSTVKETIGSGWSETFRTIFGNFEEATVLFTNINDSISGFVKGNADARNELLSGWKELGGRDVLIKSLSDAFKSLGDILAPVKEAFRDIFPATTSKRLFEITESFAEFTKSLKPSETTIENIKRIFTGLFSALDIGWEIIKNGVGFIKDLVLQVTGLGSGKLVEFTADVADFFTRLREGLDQGKDIEAFFDHLTESIPGVIQFFKELKASVIEFFDGFDVDAFDGMGEAAGRVEQRFSPLADLFKRLGDLWEPIKNFADRVGDILDNVGEVIGNWFQELGQKLADSMAPGDFDAVLDALNVSLLGGIGLLIAKFLSGGINFDFGGGIFGNISNAFEELTGVLDAMQTSIRADALLKIAGAVALLTASVVALSLIDSGDLTKALTAMAVGFAQLMASFAIINTMDVGLLNGATFSAIAGGMILLSTAILILSGAVAVLGTMSWEDLAKGLVGVTILLAVLTTSAILLSKNAGSIILASIGLVAMSTAISILAGAVALFATMEWDTLVKGFAGVAAGLLIMAGAMHLMPANMVLQGASLILIATALNILAGAVAIFGTMEWETMGKGFLGIAGGLLLIAFAMKRMPPGPKMILTSVGLIAVGVALNLIAAALKIFGTMSWEEMGRGLLAMSTALLILVVAVNTMSGALAGAAAMLIVSAALAVLAGVLISLAKVPFGDLAKAIGAIALALAVFGLAAVLLQNTGATAALLGLGVAMLLLGVAFAAFGLGALAVAKAFKLLGEAGPEAADALTDALKAIGKALPALLTGFGEGILALIDVLVDAAPVIAKGFGVLVGHIITTLTDLVPLIGDFFLALIEAILQILREAVPQIITVAIELILALLTGIRNNIYQVTDLVLEIVERFLSAIADNIEQIIDAGVDIIVAFISGITDSIDDITDAVGTLITTFIVSVLGLQQTVVNAGVQVLVNMLSGMTNNVSKIITAVGTLITTFINAVAGLAIRISNAGTNALVNFINGMTNNSSKIIVAITNLITTLINTVSNNSSRIITSGSNAVIKFVTGLGQNAGKVIKAGVDVVITFLRGVSSNTIRLATAAADILIDFLNALADVIRRKSGELRAAGRNIAGAIIDGMTAGLASKAGDVAQGAIDVAKGALNSVGNVLGISSPSKEFMKIGRFMAEGMAIGLNQDRGVVRSAISLAKRTTEAVNRSISKAVNSVDAMPEFNPVITPVLDLTRIRNGAKTISGLMGDEPTFAPDTSRRQANIIASTNVPDDDDNSAAGLSGGSSVSFEQNIYAPKQLSTSDIYKQTRNQITIAKEELNVA